MSSTQNVFSENPKGLAFLFHYFGRGLYMVYLDVQENIANQDNNRLKRVYLTCLGIDYMLQFFLQQK